MRRLLAFGVLVCVLAATTSAQETNDDQGPPGGIFCDDRTCKLPHCACPMSRPPFPKDQVPQIVHLTFDDAVTSLNIDYYHEILSGRKNPNGCPISMTFFVSHEYTDYVEVNWLWRQGNEIAVHSISHEPNINYWAYANYSVWQEEIAGMREIISHFANIPREEIIGMRAPLLQMGGDRQFKMLYDENFEYDCTWATRVYVPTHNSNSGEENHGLWPYTLDYQSPQLAECHDDLHDSCPQQKYPGLWEYPILDLFDYNGHPCAMADTCFLPTDVTTEEAVYHLLWLNFKHHYLNPAEDGPGTREPFGVFTHSAWFERDIGVYHGYLRFLDEILKLDDVFVVSLKKGLDWVKAPSTLDKLGFFKPWQCEAEPPIPNCRRFNCKYMESPLGHQVHMRSCVHCPPQYPWLRNPRGGEQDWEEYY